MADLWDRAQAGDPQACFDLGMRYNQDGRLRRGRRWLERSAKLNHADALYELGSVYLYGLGVDPEPERAVAAFQRASHVGQAGAKYRLANLLYSGIGCERASKQALALLHEAALAGEAAALTTLAVCHPIEERWQWLCAAAKQGYGLAQLLLDTHPAPSSIDPALPAVDVLQPSNPKVGRGERPHKDFAIVRFESALDSLECAYLKAISTPLLRPSLAIDPRTGAAIKHAVRTSSGASLHPSTEDIAIARIKERLAHAAGVPVTHAESFAILRYHVGEEYRPHFDFIDASSDDRRYRLKEFGQRTVTSFCYLNDVAQGGETEFPKLSLRFAPKLGDVVSFPNVHPDGTPDERSLHASLPVIEGEKWLATVWFRERPLTINAPS